MTILVGPDLEKKREIQNLYLSKQTLNNGEENNKVNKDQRLMEFLEKDERDYVS